jgi:hypothetical protein
MVEVLSGMLNTPDRLHVPFLFLTSPENATAPEIRMTIRISRVLAAQIYAVLIEICGAPPR